MASAQYTFCKSGASHILLASLPNTSLGMHLLLFKHRFLFSNFIHSHSHFTDEVKEKDWVTVVAPKGTPGVSDSREGDGPAPVQSNLSLSATLLPAGQNRPRRIPGSGAAKKAYIHVVQTSGYNSGKSSGALVRVGNGAGIEQVMSEGDGAYIHATGGKDVIVENVGQKRAEVLWFDLE